MRVEDLKEVLFFEKLRALPELLKGIETTILNPRNTWEDKKAYDEKAKELIKLFKNNFKKYESFGNYAKSGPD